jgi:CelD/BcsL family acetyltransferase involved in cellulose biosynthesis
VLPANYEQYMQESLGRNTRKHLRNCTRRIEQLNDFMAAPAREDDLEVQINTLLTFYQERWGVMTEDIITGFRKLFRFGFENNILWLTTLWEGATPIAGEACFLDHKMKTVYSYTGAFNKHYARLSPGNVMTAYAIRWAIEHGFRKYSFGAGGEHYKYLFGAAEHYNRHVVITRKSFITRMKESIPPAFKDTLKSAVHTLESGLGNNETPGKKDDNPGIS